MTKELDAGDIIHQEAIPINDDETYDSLYLKLCDLGKQIIKKKYIDLFADNVKCTKQEANMVSYAPNITRKDEFIDWSKPARLIIRKINGLYSKPIASTIYEGKPIKIFKASITNQKTVNHQPGTIISIDKKGIRIATIDYDIVFITIQLPNKKPQAVSQLINGNHPFKILTQFSNYR
jgi:methionyl-tRNA formyltransferase